MKTNLPCRLFIFLAVVMISFFASAQYSIDWYKISGGGGTSTGGVYSVSGTIGQPDAGSMSGGNYTLTGGFWAAVTAVQTEGAPLLSITYPEPGSVKVSWSLTTGWRLEHCTTLAGNPPPWTLVNLSGYQTNSGQVSLTAPLSPGNKFYRLHKP